jgi:exodeoxyribonuclease-3
MRITSWNVNSVRARENRILNWLDQQQPDVLCLQELKCLEEQFPFDGFEQLGYEVSLLGQKGYNGVAIASTGFQDEVQERVPWEEDEDARGISAVVDGVRVVTIYVPNGREAGSDHWHYKLEWLERLQGWLDANASPDEPLVICGDFNVAPDDRDVWDPAAMGGHNLCTTEERERLQSLLDWGLQDAQRVVSEAAAQYTWWDFLTDGFVHNHGLRIDLHLVTAPIVERLEAVEIDTVERGGDKPSDHAPVTLVLRDE